MATPDANRKVRFNPNDPIVDWAGDPLPAEKQPDGTTEQPKLGHLLRQVFNLYRPETVELSGLCFGIGRRIRAAEKSGQVYVAGGPALDMIKGALEQALPKMGPMLLGQLANAFGIALATEAPAGEVEPIEEGPLQSTEE